jgi:sporulation integral membrane protein YtvI
MRTVGYLAFLFAAIYLVFRYVLSYVLPFVVGVLLAFILEPGVSFLAKKTRVGRAWAAVVVILLLVGGLGYLVSWSVTRIAAEITDLYGYLPQYYGEFNRVVSEMLRIAGDISQQLPEPLARVAQDQWNRLYSLLSVIVSGAGGVVRTVPAVTVTTVFAFLSAYFVMKDRAAIGAFARSIIPARAFTHFKNVEMDILSGVAGFIRAQAVLIVLTMIVNVIVLSILGSRYAVALGLLLAVLDVLPIVGPGLIYLPWIGYHLLWGGASYALWLLTLYGSVSLLRQVIQTHLVGREMGLHPLVTLLSLYVGARLFGAPGLIYGPLTAILVKALWASGAIPHEGGAFS